MPYRCVYPLCLDERLLSSTVHVFQARSRTLRNAAWSLGQGRPSVKLRLLFSDAEVGRCGLGQTHAENTWQTEAPGLPDPSMANAIGKTIPQFPKRFQDPTGVGGGGVEMG